MNFVNIAKDWIHDRATERTSWDGAMLIVAGLSFIFFNGIATLVAWGAVAYGIWTLVKED
jgi:hypothetical protein|tara:strand:- start:51 stop:230 length:180 start_codon:yes stop_codon:yes gene_type:complete